MALISPSVFNALASACAKYGVTLLDADKAKLEALLDPLADNDANAVVSAIAAHINLNGLAGVMQNPLRNAITGAEPTLDAVINQNIDGGYDALEAWFAIVAKAAS